MKMASGLINILIVLALSASPGFSQEAENAIEQKPDSSVVQKSDNTEKKPISAKQLVVMIDGRFPTSGASTEGAGIVVGRKGGLVYIATAGHVVQGFSEAAVDIKVQFQDRPGEEVDATLWPSNLDKSLDLAVLVVPEDKVPDTITSIKEFSAARLSESVKTGEGVYLFGQPSGKVWSGNKSPEEVVSSTSTSIEVESDTVVPGMSGGATFDEGYRIIGLIVEADNGLARALPLKLVKESLERGGYPFSLTDSSGASSFEAEQESSKRLAAYNIKNAGFELSQEGLRNAMYSGGHLISEYLALGFNYKSSNFLADISQSPNIKSTDNYLSVLEYSTGDEIEKAVVIGSTASKKIYEAFYSADSLIGICDEKEFDFLPKYVCESKPGYDFSLKLSGLIDNLSDFSADGDRRRSEIDVPKKYISDLAKSGKIEYVSDLVNDGFVKNIENNRKTFVTDLKFNSLPNRPLISGTLHEYDNADDIRDRLNINLYREYCPYSSAMSELTKLCEMKVAVFIDDGELIIGDQLISDDKFKEINAPHWKTQHYTDINRAVANNFSIDKRLEVIVPCDRGFNYPELWFASAIIGDRLKFSEIISGNDMNVSISTDNGYKDTINFEKLQSAAYVYWSIMDANLYGALTSGATEMSVIINGEKFRISLAGANKSINEAISAYNCEIGPSTSRGGAKTTTGSWTQNGFRAYIPRELTSNDSRVEFICHSVGRQWYLVFFNESLLATPPTPVKLIVDGRPFYTTTDYLIDTESILLNDDMIDALMKGSRAEITFFLAGSGTSVIEKKVTFSLRGSARALGAAMANCPYTAPETPETAPDRFASDWRKDDSPETMAIIDKVYGAKLAEMRQESDDSDLNISDPYIADLGNGWKFLKADIGPSNYHFGFGYWGSVLLAKPPNEEWQDVGMRMPAYYLSFDMKNSHPNNWPRLVTQPHRGNDPPHVFWIWNGETYVIQYEYPQGKLW